MFEYPLTFVTLIAQPTGAGYLFLDGDFLFDANVINSMYQDPFKTILVTVSGDNISYFSKEAAEIGWPLSGGTWNSTLHWDDSETWNDGD